VARAKHPGGAGRPPEKQPRRQCSLSLQIIDLLHTRGHWCTHVKTSFKTQRLRAKIATPEEMLLAKDDSDIDWAEVRAYAGLPGCTPLKGLQAELKKGGVILRKSSWGCNYLNERGMHGAFPVCGVRVSPLILNNVCARSWFPLFG